MNPTDVCSTEVPVATNAAGSSRTRDELILKGARREAATDFPNDPSDVRNALVAMRLAFVIDCLTSANRARRAQGKVAVRHYVTLGGSPES